VATESRPKPVLMGHSGCSIECNRSPVRQRTLLRRRPQRHLNERSRPVVERLPPAFGAHSSHTR
jgi:hypothetical protein